MARLKVDVVLALRDEQDIVRVELDEGARALDALAASGLRQRHPEIDFNALRLGVFGKEIEAGASLSDGDRVELYRPLAVDPKDARRARARRKVGRNPAGRKTRR
jgi:putative ubiquitin-RnfH superfamily antitoxin RatB of RatAB toxin-antitoxin module